MEYKSKEGQSRQMTNVINHPLKIYFVMRIADRFSTVETRGSPKMSKREINEMKCCTRCDRYCENDLL